jgi:hypothetical protein
LLDHAGRIKPELERFRELCERVAGYYVVERYPPLGALNLDTEDIQKDQKEAREFVKTMFPNERLSR